ncbi:hypothetical protein AB1A81_05010 [Bdellovibrio bacteriovorus]|uniref:Uncharacterized protein n=1 Tax=Bdellovibrio bacteriovorus (strain ATCC 15356 / DSM 50701 / NCIMB 9529 / HD100) TaxID=264462 RepID=Q6MNY5_BDEBA|nr:hypothetical protein [Bdellovibrio bacteriovorus]CAE79014.1 hypothetical protein predicted by Glimmer/Critica [Bdellovibrio bacteriovorus HD100]
MAFFLVFLFSWNVFAGEPDNFSARRDKNAVVANAEINRVVNALLVMALDNYNYSSKSCDRKRFLKYLEDDLDRNLPQITKALYFNVPQAGPKVHTEVPYGSGKPYTQLYFSQSAKVQVKDATFIVGFDKIDHFFSHGSMYWDMVGQDPKLPADKVKKALEVGIMQENATWGLQRPGVKSYADLMANYKGLYFWRDLFDGAPPLIVCKDGKFVQNREFDLANYFEPAMDETINCSSFATQEIHDRITAVTKKWNMNCPVDANACETAKKVHADKAALLLHPKCRGTGNSQIEKASPMTTKDVIDTAQAAMSGGGDYLLFKLFGEKKKKGAQ